MFKWLYTKSFKMPCLFDCMSGDTIRLKDHGIKRKKQIIKLIDLETGNEIQIYYSKDKKNIILPNDFNKKKYTLMYWKKPKDIRMVRKIFNR